MPYAYVQVFPGLSAADYYRVVDALGEEPYPGLVVHLAGPCEEGWRVIQVWEDASAYLTFQRQRLWDALAQANAYAAGSAPPVAQSLTVEHVVVGQHEGTVASGDVRA